MTEPATDATPEAEVRHDGAPDAEVSHSDSPDAEDQDDADDATFPRAYVDKLRAESARYRERAKSTDVLAQRLHTELVRATGKLADPSDLEFDEAHLEDPELLAAAVDQLLERKPHLASRRPVGDIGQGQRGAAGDSPGLLSILKGLA